MPPAPPHSPPAGAPLKAIDKPPQRFGRHRALALTALIVGWILLGSLAAAGTSPLSP